MEYLVDLITAVSSDAKRAAQIESRIDAVKRAAGSLGVLLCAGACVSVRTSNLLREWARTVRWLGNAREGTRTQVLCALCCVYPRFEPAGIARLKDPGKHNRTENRLA